MNRRDFLKRVTLAVAVAPAVGLLRFLPRQPSFAAGYFLALDFNGQVRLAQTSDQIVGVSTGVGREWISYGAFDVCSAS